MKIFVSRSGPYLKPSFSDDADKLSKIPEGQNLQFTFKRVRSARQHNLFFALIKFAHDHLPDNQRALYPTPENLRQALLLTCGFASTVVSLDGSVSMVVQSMDYANMDRMEFQDCFERVTTVINDRIVTLEGQIENELVF